MAKLKAAIGSFMISILSSIFKRGSFPLFLLIGGVNTLFGYSVFGLGIYCGLHYTVASLISLCLGIIFNFHTLGKIVFDRFEKKLIFKFVVIYFVYYFLSILFLKTNSYFITNMYINGFVVTMLMALLSFLLNKNIVFRK
jgi:putative flippase GtrA